MMSVSTTESKHTFRSTACSEKLDKKQEFPLLHPYCKKVITTEADCSQNSVQKHMNRKLSGRENMIE